EEGMVLAKAGRDLTLAASEQYQFADEAHKLKSGGVPVGAGLPRERAGNAHTHLQPLYSRACSLTIQPAQLPAISETVPISSFPLQKTIKNRRPDRFTLCPTQAAQVLQERGPKSRIS
ncbi:hypothetical protein ACQKPT_17975, partial [Pseudomonas monteilii]|uniref:hypothetical protein n=1 Tax=Pseudomonas monteilii TaxID=76759 RepID=UPI003D06CF36